MQTLKRKIMWAPMYYSWPLDEHNDPLPTVKQAQMMNYLRAQRYCHRIHDDLNAMRELRGEAWQPFTFPSFEEMYHGH